MITLRQDGLRLCLDGVSSLDEIRRVTGDRLELAAQSRSRMRDAYVGLAGPQRARELVVPVRLVLAALLLEAAAERVVRVVVHRRELEHLRNSASASS